MKKVISVFLAVILALSTFAFGTTVSFADEQNDLYYEDDYNTPDQSVISDISVSCVGKTDIEIYWNCSYYGWVDGYEISLFDDKTNTYYPKAYVDGDNYYCVLRSLNKNTRYKICVRSYVFQNGSYAFGDYSAPVSVMTAPKGTSLSSAKYTSKGKVSVKWKKAKNVSGYVIEYSRNKKFKDDGSKCTVFVSGKSKSSKTISGLAKGKYYFRIATYKTIGNARYISTFSKVKSTTVKSNLSVKQILNAVKTDNSGAKQIKRYTDGGVNISKYKTTYDKFKAIYVWHAKNFKKHGWNCVGCNSNFNNCLAALFAKSQKRYDDFITLEAGKVKNNDGSRPIHKWAVIYLAGKPYIFDPRLQGYTKSYTPTTYFAIAKGSKRAKAIYIYENGYGTFHPDESNVYLQYCVDRIK